MAETRGRFTMFLYVIVSNYSAVVCMNNVKYIPRLKRVEDLNDVNKRSLYFANVDFMNVTERRTAYLYADLCTRVSVLYIIS
jgi:hypothetical protein